MRLSAPTLSRQGGARTIGTLDWTATAEGFIKRGTVAPWESLDDRACDRLFDHRRAKLADYG